MLITRSSVSFRSSFQRAASFRQPLQCPNRYRIISTVTTDATIARRRQFEDDYHLARTLSRFNLDPDQEHAWSAQTRSWTRRPWTLPPLECSTQAPFEADALQETHQRSFYANVLLEVRDVRLPASTHHPSFTRLARHRRHLICYTHADLVDGVTRDRVEAWTRQSWPNAHAVFVDTRESRTNDDLMAAYDHVLTDFLWRHLEDAGGPQVALTVGCANTGKSSLLLALLRTARTRGEIPKAIKVRTDVVVRPPPASKAWVFRGGASRPPPKPGKKRSLAKHKFPGIADRPGLTRTLTEYLLRDKPRAYFLDVPGLTPPSFFFADRPAAWFGFGAANLIPLSDATQSDAQVQTALCDYVLHCLNRDGAFGYVCRAGLDGPTRDVMAVLAGIKRGKPHMSPVELQLARCRTFLKLFNTGNFGSVVLDDLSRPFEPFLYKKSHFNKSLREASSDSEDVFFDDDFKVT